MYRIRVIQSTQARNPQLQRSVKEYVIPYERLSTTMQKLNQSGCEILSLTHP